MHVAFKTVFVFLLLILNSALLHAAPCNYTIGHYTSGAWGFYTNSFWIEGPTGVILVDTQFLPSATREAVEVAETYTGKKVVLAIVLHANPDKFNGTGYLQQRGIKVVTSTQVRELMPAVDALRRQWFYDRYKPDYPQQLALPDSFGDTSSAINAAGLTLKMHVFGTAVSRAHVVLELDGHLFVGDLVANKHHAWMELGELDNWVKILTRLKQLKPEYIHPGRGYASGPGLLDTQIAYLNFVKDRLSQRHPRDEISDTVKEELVSTITQQYPNYGNEYFLQLGVPAIWEKMAAHDAN